MKIKIEYRPSRDERFIAGHAVVIPGDKVMSRHAIAATATACRTQSTKPPPTPSMKLCRFPMSVASISPSTTSTIPVLKPSNARSLEMLRNANTIAICLFSGAMAVALAYIAYTTLSTYQVADEIIGEDSQVSDRSEGYSGPMDQDACPSKAYA